MRGGPHTGAAGLQDAKGNVPRSFPRSMCTRASTNQVNFPLEINLLKQTQ